MRPKSSRAKCGPHTLILSVFELCDETVTPHARQRVRVFQGLSGLAKEFTGESCVHAKAEAGKCIV